jgi:hypothetical protein
MGGLGDTARRVARRLHLRGPRARLVFFYLELPHPLGIPDGSTFSFELSEKAETLIGLTSIQNEGDPPVRLDGRLFVGLRFWQVVARDDLVSNVDVVDEAMRRALPEHLFPDRRSERKAPDEFTKQRTVVEALTPILFDDPTDRDPVTDAFERCLMSLREAVRAYRVSAHDRIALPTRERLPTGIPFVQRSLKDPNDWTGISLFLLNMNIEVPPEPLDDDGMERLAVYLSHFKNGHPLAPYSEQTLETFRAFQWEGDYGGAVVAAQTAIEVLLDGVLTLMLWEEGQDPIQVATTIYSRRLKTRVRGSYPARLGGVWNTTGQGVVARWAQEVAPLRNRVVHAAYSPTYDEASAAVSIGIEIDKYMRDRLVARRERFPRTTLLMLGRPGLERYERTERGGSSSTRREGKGSPAALVSCQIDPGPACLPRLPRNLHTRLNKSLIGADVWSVTRVQERATHPRRPHARDRLERLQSVFKFVPVRFRCHIS